MLQETSSKCSIFCIGGLTPQRHFPVYLPTWLTWLSSSPNLLTGRQRMDGFPGPPSAKLIRGLWELASNSPTLSWWLNPAEELPCIPSSPGTLSPAAVHFAEWQAEVRLFFPGSTSPPSAQLDRCLPDPVLNFPPALWLNPSTPMCTKHCSSLPFLTRRHTLCCP